MVFVLFSQRSVNLSEAFPYANIITSGWRRLPLGDLMSTGAMLSARAGVILALASQRRRLFNNSLQILTDEIVYGSIFKILMREKDKVFIFAMAFNVFIGKWQNIIALSGLRYSAARYLLAEPATIL